MNEEQFDQLMKAVYGIRNSVTPYGKPGQDSAGGQVGCLTEAVMGITAGLFAVSHSLDGIAAAIREGQNTDDF